MTRLIAFALLCCSAVSAEQIAPAVPFATTVDGNISSGKRLQCKAYLSPPSIKSAQPKLLFSIRGTGFYTTYFDHNKKGDYYFLTFDKPGVAPNLKDHDKPAVDRSQFDLYTLSTLIDCAQNALNWAFDYLKKPQIKIIVHGHSEGSYISINLAKRMPSKFKAIFLSGVITKHMREIVDAQFKGEDLKNLMRSHKRHDSDFLFNNWGIGWYWADDVLKGDNSKLFTLSSLAESAETRKLPIEIFQGLLDQETPGKEVLSFESDNLKKPKDKQLALHARYYNAPHGLNYSALVDVDALLEYYFNDASKDKAIPSTIPH